MAYYHVKCNIDYWTKEDKSDKQTFPIAKNIQAFSHDDANSQLLALIVEAEYGKLERFKKETRDLAVTQIAH